MKKIIREYLLKNTPKTLTPIVDGIKGDVSKIDEEYHELKDAIEQDNNMLTFIEGCDLIDANLSFLWARFKVPTLLIILVIYVRCLYKPIRNRIYDFAGLSKDDFNS